MKLKKESWYIRTRMKAHARDIVVQSYGLTVSDDTLLQWRENHDVLPKMSDARLSAKILQGFIIDLLMVYVLNFLVERVAVLIGSKDHKRSFYLYGGGTVSHPFHVGHRLNICRFVFK